jgi:thiamine-phosphate pyrophosphorylase
VDEVTDSFAQAFAPRDRAPCSLYLISPQDVGGAFPDRLKAALEPGVATAFQMRVKDMDEHALARLAEPLQRIHPGVARRLVLGAKEAAVPG